MSGVDILLSIFFWGALFLILGYLPYEFVRGNEKSPTVRAYRFIRLRLAALGGFLINHIYALIIFCIVGSSLSLFIFMWIHAKSAG